MKREKAVGGKRRFIFMLFIFRYIFLFTHAALFLQRLQPGVLCFIKDHRTCGEKMRLGINLVTYCT